MASAAAQAAVASPRGSGRAHERSAADVAAAAWLCAIPCAAIVVIAVVVLGPPVGALLFPAHPPYTFMAAYVPVVYHEPTEQARFLLTLSAPLVATLALALLPPWSPSRRRRSQVCSSRVSSRRTAASTLCSTASIKPP